MVSFSIVSFASMRLAFGLRDSTAFERATALHALNDSPVSACYERPPPLQRRRMTSGRKLRSVGWTFTYRQLEEPALSPLLVGISQAHERKWAATFDAVD
jgi:hypothetical protein